MSDFKEKIIEVLDIIYNLCERVESIDYNTREGIVFCIGDIIPPLKGTDEIIDVINYISKNGLNVLITRNFEDDPRCDVGPKKYENIESIPLGLVKGRNLKSIKKIISEIKDKIYREEVKERKNKNPTRLKLLSLGIDIKDKYIIHGNRKLELNPADTEIINFLHMRYIENKEICAPIETIKSETGLDEGYISNRISKINTSVRKLITTNKKTTIDNFIKFESRRGYHLNSRFLITNLLLKSQKNKNH